MANEKPIEEKYTKYEIARILGARALQLSMNAPCLLKIEKEKLEEIKYDALKIAELEFRAGVLPITVKRPLPQKYEAEELEEPEETAAEKEEKEEKRKEELIKKKEINEEMEVETEEELEEKGEEDEKKKVDEDKEERGEIAEEPEETAEETTDI